MSRRRAQHDANPSALTLIRRFGPYVRKHRLLLGGSLLAMFAEVGLRLLEPWPLKFVFDRIVGAPASGGGAAPMFADVDPAVLVTACAVGLVVVVGLRAGSSYIRRVGFALAGNLILTDCRSDLFAHLQRLSLSFHTKRKTGDLTTRLTSDIGRLQEVVSTALLPLIAHCLTVVAIAVVMLIMEWRLALVAFFVIPLFWLSTKRLGEQIRTTARRERERQGEMGSIATEAIGSIRVVQSLGGEDEHTRHFRAKNISSLKEGVRGKRLEAMLLGTADVFVAAGTAIVLWLGARFALQAESGMTIGDLVVFLAYYKNMARPIRNVAKYSGRTAKALASAERIVEILDTTPTIRESPGAVEAPQSVEEVTFDRVTFTYEGKKPAIDGVSLVSRRGEVTALVGPSGAGKSTLMSLLLRLYDPQAGAIAADGAELHRFTIASWRSRVAVVPQEPTLFGCSVRDNIVFGRPGVSQEQVIEAARLVSAHEFIAALPEGYDTILGERGCTLSEGQRHRIALARAAVRDAPVLIFDEPTASLDTENARIIGEAIRNLSRGRVCFIISHDLRTIADADQIVCMDDGRVIERGTHEELLVHAGRYAALYEARRGSPVGAGEVARA